MLKVIGLSMLTSIALVSPQVHAQSMDLKLAPHESKMIANNYMWTINATCTIQSSESKKKIIVNALKNNSTVNGHNLSSGQKTSVLVGNNDSIVVSAEPGAQVTILNSGVEPVEANCST